jgi:selenophosphate synthase
VEGGRATVAEGVDPLLDALMFDPETSGPLLLSVAEANAPALVATFADAGAPLWEIGRVRTGSGIELLP